MPCSRCSRTAASAFAAAAVVACTCLLCPEHSSCLVCVITVTGTTAEARAVLMRRHVALARVYYISPACRLVPFDLFVFVHTYRNLVHALAHALAQVGRVHGRGLRRVPRVLGGPDAGGAARRADVRGRRRGGGGDEEEGVSGDDGACAGGVRGAGSAGVMRVRGLVTCLRTRDVCACHSLVSPRTALRDGGAMHEVLSRAYLYGHCGTASGRSTAL